MRPVRRPDAPTIPPGEPTLYFISFILKNLTRRPIRSSLTILGLGVAVGSMVALLGVSHNIGKSVLESFTRRGVDLIVTETDK